MDAIKKRKKKVVAIISAIVVAIVSLGTLFAIYVLHLGGISFKIFVGVIIAVSVVAAIVIDRICIPFMFHDNKQFSRLIYKARLFDEGKSVGDVDQLKKRLLDFAQAHPDLEGEAYRYLGDIAFTQRDTADAVRYYSKAVGQLSRDSEDYFHVLNRRVACLLRYGSLEEAFQGFQQVASFSPIHSVGLGAMYEFGWGTEPNLNEAIQCYTQAARNGNDNAVVNRSEVEWRMTHPVPNPDGYATYMLKWHSQEGFMAGVPDLEASAEAGYAPSQYELGTLYMEGKLGNEKYADAFRWLRKAADQNYLPAMHNLGFLVQMRCMDPIKGDINKPVSKKPLLFTNEVRVASFNAGFDLIVAAAEAGYAPSQHSVGCTYVRSQNYPEVQKWLKLAADQGYKKAIDDYETFKVYF